MNDRELLDDPEMMKKFVEKQIKLGKNRDELINALRRVVTHDVMKDDILTVLVNEVVDSHASYDLIQSVMNNKLIIEKNGIGRRGEIIHILGKKGIIDTISKTTMRDLFSKPNFTSSTYPSEFVYDPYDYDLLRKDGVSWKFNVYKPPFWMKEYFHSGEEVKIESVRDIPKLYKKFLMHLVDSDDKSYEYILDWLATAIKGRNRTILTTVGTMGIGKGLLGNVMEELVGTENFTETDNKLIQKDFNGQCRNKRIVYVDEILIKNSSEMNKVKLLVNENVEIESKGFDAVNVKNYASIYTSSNDLDSIQLPADDRRFSIVNLTDKTIVKTTINIKGLTDRSNVEKLAKYLWHREVSYNMQIPFTSKRTEEMREASLKSWEDYFIFEYCVKNAGKTIKLKQVGQDIADEMDFARGVSKRKFKDLEKIYSRIFKVVTPQSKDGEPRRDHIRISNK